MVLVKPSSGAVKDFAHRVSIGLIIAGLLFLTGVARYGALELSESRWWRDITHQTPFGNVHVLTAKAAAHTLTVTGSLEKLRPCHTVGPPTIAIIKDDRAFFGWFDASLEPKDTPESRPVIGLPWEFGPWVFHSTVPWPSSAIMLRTHDCGPNDQQSNVVMHVDWKDFVGDLKQ